MFNVDCDCRFGLCGPHARKQAINQARPFSRSFVQRAQTTARRPSLSRREGRRGFAEKALEPTWRVLDAELAAAEEKARSDRST